MNTPNSFTHPPPPPLDSYTQVLVDDSSEGILNAMQQVMRCGWRGEHVLLDLTCVRSSSDLPYDESLPYGATALTSLLRDVFYQAAYGSAQRSRVSSVALSFAVRMSALNPEIAQLIHTQRLAADPNIRLHGPVIIVIPRLVFDLARSGDPLYLLSTHDVALQQGRTLGETEMTRERYEALVRNGRVHHELFPEGARGLLQQLVPALIDSPNFVIEVSDIPQRAFTEPPVFTDLQIDDDSTIRSVCVSIARFASRGTAFIRYPGHERHQIMPDPRMAV